ncbi:hypothetical protein [Pelosinus sp. IPA-1]|uniref:hypothetical protein n=1 Tax=Pelosinus sp. IPA-1 TaxID=3029569 RepID=UPI00243620A2|nr:hypothetical protein [Pelosinus sp. IPA-1]GMB02051.1 hypothetical protein PIPA1_48510 [Pelosinus sp. IPA-1]
MTESDARTFALLIWRNKSKQWFEESNHCMIAPMPILKRFVKKNQLKYKMTSVSYYDIGEPFDETVFLTSIPRMKEKILKGMKTPLSECVEDNLQ